MGHQQRKKGAIVLDFEGDPPSAFLSARDGHLAGSAFNALYRERKTREGSTYG
jgi:hypothetical protein